MRSSTSESNGVRVGYEVFAGTVAFPATPTSAYAEVDLRLASDGLAVDRALLIPGLNDDFHGSGPDLGALEFDPGTAAARIFRDGFE